MKGQISWIPILKNCFNWLCLHWRWAFTSAPLNMHFLRMFFFFVWNKITGSKCSSSFGPWNSQNSLGLHIFLHDFSSSFLCFSSSSQTLGMRARSLQLLELRICSEWELLLSTDGFYQLVCGLPVTSARVSRLSKRWSLNCLPETFFFPVDKDCGVRDDWVGPLVWQHLEAGRQVAVAFLEETRAGRKWLSPSLQRHTTQGKCAETPSEQSPEWR